MFKKITFSVFIFLSSMMQADIVEIDRLDEIRPYILQQNALVLFDLDDTLITNPTSIGSPAWRNWAKTRFPKYNADFAVYDALTLHIAKNIPYKAVEANTAKVIGDLQQDGIAALAFTARGRTQWYTTDIEGVDQFTHEQLQQVGIDFKKTKIPDELQNLDSAHFHEGIIFAKHMKKGELLQKLLKDLPYRPSCIVFVDDRRDQVQSVEAAVKEMEIPFVGLWYRRVERDLANFTPRVANVQLKYLLLENRILSDKEAEEIAKTLPDADSNDHLHQILDRFDVKELAPTRLH